MTRVGFSPKPGLTLQQVKDNIEIGDLLASTLAELNAKVSDATLVDSPVSGDTVIVGLAANKPDAAGIAEGIYYYEIDTFEVYKIVSAAWVLQTGGSAPFEARDATLTQFRSSAATGTMFSPQMINDNNVATDGKATINEYADVDYGLWVLIDQWRIHGRPANNEDGEWKIEYWGTDHAWHDFKTGIPTNKAVWTGMDVVTEVTCMKVRLFCVVEDTGADDSACGELEVYHS